MSAATYVKAKDVAERINASMDTVYELAQAGKIPVAFRLGPHLRFDMDAVIRALEEGQAE